MRRISLLPSLSGNGISICTSKRLGLNKALFNSCCLFVIPIRITYGMASTPSNFASIWFTVELRVVTPLSSADEHFRKMGSISSIMITCRADYPGSPLTEASSASASWKSSRTSLSDPPTQQSSSSGACGLCVNQNCVCIGSNTRKQHMRDMECMHQIGIRLHIPIPKKGTKGKLTETILGALARRALAISRAKAVLPHPGGPYRSTIWRGYNNTGIAMQISMRISVTTNKELSNRPNILNSKTHSP